MGQFICEIRAAIFHMKMASIRAMINEHNNECHAMWNEHTISG